MPSFDALKTPPKDIYKLIIGSVVPRPIAWVSSCDENGVPNLAPFSFFNAVCSNPPTLLFCPTVHPVKNKKDTLKNIEATKEFVVNIVSENLAEKMNATAASFDYGISEFKECGLEPLPSATVTPPRVKGAPVSFECSLNQVVYIGDGSLGSGAIVIGTIKYIHVLDTIYKNGHIDVAKMRPVARLAGADYSKLGDIFSFDRPK